MNTLITYLIFKALGLIGLIFLAIADSWLIYVAWNWDLFSQVIVACISTGMWIFAILLFKDLSQELKNFLEDYK